MSYWDQKRIKLDGLEAKTAWINDDKTTIKLDCGDKWVAMDCYADCCSETWIEHIDGVNDLLRSRVVSTEDVTLGEVIPTRQDFDQLYAFKAKLEPTQPHVWGKEFAIEFRNSSNGYYGGTLEIFECDSKLDGFKPLTEDF